MYRFDFVFSYWIFLWYILYEFGVTSFNPKLGILIGLIENAFLLAVMIYYKNDSIFLFCLINTFLKVIPFWRLRHTLYRKKDAYALLVYFMLYLVWVSMNENVLVYAKGRIKNIKENKPAFPLIQYIKSLNIYR